MVNLGTIEAQQAKRNRMTAFLLPEADIPRGSSTLRVRYGPDPAASLIYLATVLNIDQASASTPPGVLLAIAVPATPTPAARYRSLR